MFVNFVFFRTKTEHAIANQPSFDSINSLQEDHDNMIEEQADDAPKPNTGYEPKPRYKPSPKPNAIPKECIMPSGPMVIYANKIYIEP